MSICLGIIIKTKKHFPKVKIRQEEKGLMASKSTVKERKGYIE